MNLSSFEEVFWNLNFLSVRVDRNKMNEVDIIWYEQVNLSL